MKNLLIDFMLTHCYSQIYIIYHRLIIWMNVLYVQVTSALLQVRLHFHKVIHYRNSYDHPTMYHDDHWDLISSRISAWSSSECYFVPKQPFFSSAKKQTNKNDLGQKSCKTHSSQSSEGFNCLSFIYIYIRTTSIFFPMYFTSKSLHWVLHHQLDQWIQKSFSPKLGET